MALQHQDQPYQYEDFVVLKIPSKRIDHIWQYASPHIITGLSVAPELRIDDVIEGLIDESIQLWIIVNGHEICAAFLTSIERDRMEWVVSLYALGGSGARHWMNACDDMIGAFARQEGASRIRMCGRTAWQRLLPETFSITGERGGHNVYERSVS